MVTRTRNSYKLNRHANGKLCLDCCPNNSSGGTWCACCEDGFWIPGSFNLTLSGVHVNNTPSWIFRGDRYQWCDVIEKAWQWFDFDTVDGTYTIPMVPYKDGNGICHCGGSLEVPWDGIFYEYWDPGGGWCTAFTGPRGWRDYEFPVEKLRLSISSGALPVANPTIYRITVTVEAIVNRCPAYTTCAYPITVFQGTIEKPINEKTCFNESVENSLVTPYVCQPYTVWCQEQGMTFAWGGTATIEPEGTYERPIWLKSLTNPPGVYAYSGDRYVFTYCEFGKLECPGSGRFKVQCKVTCNAGTFIYESPTYYAGNYIGLYVRVPYEGVLGYTTFEIVDIVPIDPNIIWDRSRDLVPSIVSGVFA